MKILFYSPVNFRCRDLESLAHRYKQEGHQAYFLTQCEEGPMHFEMRKNGIQSWSSKGRRNLVAEVFRIVIFCYRYKINALYSHLEPTNFISVIAQNFIFSRVIIFRHHINEAQLYNFDTSFAYRFTYKMARCIIAVSEEARDYMINVEKIKPEKIKHINLGYNFSHFEKIDLKNSIEIRNTHASDILLIFVGRLTRYKNPKASIDLLLKLLAAGVNAKLLILGRGEEENSLNQYVKENQLQGRVFFEGFVLNTLDYLAASDVLVHPSVLESSCVVVKEAALVGLPVMVCKNVGDFKRYIKHSNNGFLLDDNAFVQEGFQILMNYKKEQLIQIGERLKIDIFELFSIDHTFEMHLKLVN